MKDLVCPSCERVGKIKLRECIDGKFIFYCVICNNIIVTDSQQDFRDYCKIIGLGGEINE